MSALLSLVPLDVLVPLDLGTELAGGSMVVAVPIAVLAGLVAFFSPCVVPLLPGYVSYATGLGAADVVAGKGNRGRMLAGMVLFVLGFAAVFVATGALIGGVGGFLLTWKVVITRVMGAVIIALGLVFLGLVPFARRELRISTVPRIGIAAAPLLGVVFGLGWTPCIGPTLGIVYTLALTEGTALRASVLALAYALGLGVPFVVAGVAFTSVSRAVTFLRRRQQLFMRFGGLLMVATGVLMVTGLWDQLTGLLRQLTASFSPVI